MSVPLLAVPPAKVIAPKDLLSPPKSTVPVLLFPLMTKAWVLSKVPPLGVKTRVPPPPPSR